jgi:hypothetical protein
MPEICRFLGVVITMNFNDHAPPHFHAQYGEFTVSIEISTGLVMRGSLPRRVLGLVVEWASLHRDELHSNWRLARAGSTPNRIAPLE